MAGEDPAGDLQKKGATNREIKDMREKQDSQGQPE